MSESQSQILLEDGLFSFTYVYKPYKNQDGGQSYTTHWIFPQTHPQYGALQALIRQVALRAWADKTEEYLTAAVGQDKLCIHRGDVSKPGQEVYKGMLYLSASRKFEDGPPRIVDENRNEITVASGKLYSGARGNIIVNLWAQNNTFGRRINAEITGVQHTAHGKKLSGSGALARADEFKVVAKAADGATPTAVDASRGLI